MTDDRSISNFKKGSVAMMILQLLSEGDKYGYQIAQIINTRSQGQLKIKDGSLYPALYRLQDAGFIESDRVPSGKRRIRTMYHILEPGTLHLELLKNEYAKINYEIQLVVPGIELGKEGLVISVEKSQ